MLMPWLKPCYQRFASALAQQRLPGSVIISGSEGMGASDLALECAKLYLCQSPGTEGPCGECRSCIAFEAGSHPDFFIALPSTAEEAANGEDISKNRGFLADLNDKRTSQRRTLRVDTIRRLNGLLHESSAFSFRKAAIVHDAHTLGESAANALLKTFEEPPEDSLIILVTNSLSAMLPTLLSRAFKLELSSLNPEDALRYLKEQGFETDRSRVALALAGSGPFLALKLLREELDFGAVAAAKAASALLSGGSVQDFVLPLAKLDGESQVKVLTLLVKELLCLKAGMPVSELPLLEAAAFDAENAQGLDSEQLFEIANLYPYLKAQLPLIPTRTPQALLREAAFKLSGKKVGGSV